MKIKSVLLLVVVLIGISVNGAAQTTTGTAQKVGNIWYYNFYTQPAPQIYVQQPLIVPRVDYFAPFNASVQNFQFAQQLRLQREALNLERQRLAWQQQLEANQVSSSSKAERMWIAWVNERGLASLGYDTCKMILVEEWQMIQRLAQVQSGTVRNYVNLG